MARSLFNTSQDDFLDYTLTRPEGGTAADVRVVYVHGFASDQSGEKAQYFKEQFNNLGAAFLAFDHRGHGKSSGTMKELTVTRNLEDLERVLKETEKDFSKTILIGSSMGGQTAAWHALRNPGTIAANLLIAPAFRFFQNRLEELGAEGLERIKKDGFYTMKNDWVEVTVGLELFDDAPKYTMDDLLKDYRTPTLILHGSEDASVPIQDSVNFTRKSQARPSDLLMIGGGDHRLTDHKETLFQAMKGFCENLGILP